MSPAKYDKDLVLLLYTEGWHNQRQFGELQTYLQPFVSSGHIPALIEMARIHQVCDEQAQSRKLMRRAERLLGTGDWDNVVALWSAFEGGLGYGTHEENVAKAHQYLLTLCENGNVPAQEILMTNYLHGLNGWPQDEERFLHWAARAAAAGSKLANSDMHKHARRKKIH